jgi:hypothetical protein
MPFLHFEAYKFCINIIFNDFHMDFIEILWYWKFVMQPFIGQHYLYEIFFSI